jgi:hypothetical protein
MNEARRAGRSGSKGPTTTRTIILIDAIVL